MRRRLSVNSPRISMPFSWSESIRSGGDFNSNSGMLSEEGLAASTSKLALKTGRPEGKDGFRKALRIFSMVSLGKIGAEDLSAAGGLKSRGLRISPVRRIRRHSTVASSWLTRRRSPWTMMLELMSRSSRRGEFSSCVRGIEASARTSESVSTTTRRFMSSLRLSEISSRLILARRRSEFSRSKIETLVATSPLKGSRSSFPMRISMAGLLKACSSASRAPNPIPAVRST